MKEANEAFFASGYKENPQFEYEDASAAKKFLKQFDEPDGQYLDIAIKIIDSFLREYGTQSNYLACEGKVLDQEETMMIIESYLSMLGIQELVSVNFNSKQIAPTSVTYDPKTGKCRMNISEKMKYRVGRMIGVLDHEIGTHFLRKHNEKL